MPCVSPDGKPTASGMALLNSMKSGPMPPKGIAEAASQPLFRVRSGLRELVNAGFVEESDGQYKLSKEGEKLVE